MPEFTKQELTVIHKALEIYRADFTNLISKGHKLTEEAAAQLNRIEQILQKLEA